LASPTACQFLSRWPTLEKLQQASGRQVRDFYHAHRRLSPVEWEDLQEQIRKAQPLTSDLAVVQSWALVVPLWSAGCWWSRNEDD
jgi:hypothetical protein